MVEILGDQYEAARLKHEHDSSDQDVQASLVATIAQHGIDFLPGSVELGDFDPTATAVAIGLLDQLHLMPPAETRTTL